MRWKDVTGLLLCLCLSGFVAAGPPAGVKLDEALAAIERNLEQARQEAGVPGFGLAVVVDGRVVLNRGFGRRDIERDLPVTPQTLFAIGSCTKAFTAMAVMIGEDEGKLSLDDSPKKFLHYFELKDPEADRGATLRDLLGHTTGLGGTDLAWFSGRLSREEVIRVAGRAEPSAGFREKFQYQNVMYSAAGEAVAAAYGTSWEKLIARRFLKPLGMKSSNTSMKAMLRARDHATGYVLHGQEAKPVPMRDLKSVAPAGAINSNTTDMTRWLLLLVGGGEISGKRFVTEAAFEQMITAGEHSGSYGLGWGVLEKYGHKVATHSGGIDGFGSIVSFMPAERIGMVYLSNVVTSDVAARVQEVVYSQLLGDVAPAEDEAAETDSEPEVDPAVEVGTYDFAEVGMKIELVLEGDVLTAIVPGQPNYPLSHVSGRRHKLGAPAPSGFYMTFRPVEGDPSRTEMYLEQPQGNYVLPKVTGEDVARALAGDQAAVAAYDGPHKDLLGSYVKGPATVEVTLRDGLVTLVVPNQPPYALEERETDSFGSAALPDTFGIDVRRDDGGAVAALVLKQPGAENVFTRIEDLGAPSLSVEELMSRAIEAAGGEDRLGRQFSRVVVSGLEFVEQGLTGSNVVRARAPSSFESIVTIEAAGKQVGVIRDFFDGSSVGIESTLGDNPEYTDQQRDNLSVNAVFDPLLSWREVFAEVKLGSMSEVDGEEVYVLVKTPEKGDPVTDYISAETFLVVRRDVTSPSGPASSTFRDYRDVEGTKLPFRTVVQSPMVGRIVVTVSEVRLNVEVPDSAFQPSRSR